MNDLSPYLEQQLQHLEAEALRRRLVPLVQSGRGYIEVAGKSCLNLSGNDYLGIGTNQELSEQFYRGMGPENVLTGFGLTASASRLMTGNSPLYERLETKLAALYGTERALVFNSGYHGNVGILPVLAGKGDLILADKLCHASLIDGMRLSRARTIRYRHLDYQHLEEILLRNRGRYDRVFIVTESIFSMDGDRADLSVLIELKKRYQCTLYLDEAHSVGVLGQQGLGLAEQEGVIQEIDLLFGTFGKAMAGLGSFLVCTAPVADFLINQARPLIYSTALPPVCLNWLLFVLERIPYMTAERKRLQTLSDYVRAQLVEYGLPTGGNSQIMPVVLVDNDRTTRVADNLRQRGYWVTAIRPPTVPAETARLRLSLSAAMEQKDLESLPTLIAEAVG